MLWMVSYQIGGVSGNNTFPLQAEADVFIANNKDKWESYSVFSYIPHHSGISPMHIVFSMN